MRDNDQLSFQDAMSGLNQKQLSQILIAKAKIDATFEDEGIRIDESEARREFEDMINPRRLHQKLLAAKELLDQYDGLYSLSEDENPLNNFDICAVDEDDLEDSLPLQESVYFSRRRNNRSEEYESDDMSHGIKEFMGMTYDDDVAEVFHKLNYPEDYQWLTRFDDVDRFADCIGKGFQHDIDYIELNDKDTWPMHDTSLLDPGVEIETHFQLILTKLEDEIGDGGFRMDLGLRMPYSQKALLPSFEIRLIDFLVKHNVKPRVSLCLYKPGTEGSRACIFLTYLIIKKDSD